MSTELNRNEETVAVRSWGGVARGVVVQVLLTEREWQDWRDLEGDVQGEVVVLGEQVSAWESEGATVSWETASSLNEGARELEDHRWADMVAGRAAELRLRARAAARDNMRAL
jgi:hypothetical protein